MSFYDIKVPCIRRYDINWWLSLPSMAHLSKADVLRTHLTLKIKKGFLLWQIILNWDIILCHFHTFSKKLFHPYIFSVTRRSWNDNVSEWVTLRTELTDVTLVSEDTYRGLYWQDSGNDSYGSGVREILVLIMEVDKMADEVTNMEIDK